MAKGQSGERAVARNRAVVRKGAVTRQTVNENPTTATIKRDSFG